MRERQPDAAHGAHEGQFEAARPGCVVERVEPARRRPAGVVHQHVEPSERLDGRSEEALEVVGARDVGREGMDAGSGLGGDAVGCVARAIGVTRADRYLRPFGGECVSGGVAESGGGGGDECAFSREFEVHGLIMTRRAGSESPPGQHRGLQDRQPRDATNASTSARCGIGSTAPYPRVDRAAAALA